MSLDSTSADIDALLRDMPSNYTPTNITINTVKHDDDRVIELDNGRVVCSLCQCNLTNSSILRDHMLSQHKIKCTIRKIKGVLRMEILK